MQKIKKSSKNRAKKTMMKPVVKNAKSATSDSNVKKLQRERDEVRNRIARIQKDLKSPMSADLEDQVLQIENQEVLQGLQKIENKKLSDLETEIGMSGKNIKPLLSGKYTHTQSIATKVKKH